MRVYAGHPDHQDRGHDQESVIHGQPQQQRVHRAGHRRSGKWGNINSLYSDGYVIRRS